MKVTNPAITELAQNEVFVFGSNMSGRHGKGAAKLALQKFGAIWGRANGMQGKSYGIPTVNSSITSALPLQKIQAFVDTFAEFAAKNPSFEFLVTEIGCGLAGYKVEQIGPMFKEASKLPNVSLPKKFWKQVRS